MAYNDVLNMNEKERFTYFQNILDEYGTIVIDNCEYLLKRVIFLTDKEDIELYGSDKMFLYQSAYTTNYLNVVYFENGDYMCKNISYDISKLFNTAFTPRKVIQFRLNANPLN